jgi:hypothetical protein
MNTIGIINSGTNISFVEKITDGFNYNPDDDILTIQNSEVVFFFDDVITLPNNTFDTKKLNETIESWGYCFENEINVVGKIFVISSNLNPGEFQRIHEILNPMNIEVVYLPPTFDIDNGKIVLGTLNQFVISKLQSLFVGMGFKNLQVTSMTPSSAEILNLLDNNLRYLQHTYNKMIQEVSGDKDDDRIIGTFLGLPQSKETLDMKLKNSVLQSYIDKIKTPINFAHDIEYNLENHNIYTLNNIFDTQTDITLPLIIDGITYVDSDTVDSKKMFVVLELIKRGYTIFILEEEHFLRNKKIINELLHDFTDKVKFFKKGSDLTGQLINL